ncbi:MAG TPA: hypothetical protein PLV68_09045, partial [Ilumatobacteraceae bacterium]|nr:hypothetical protein [Ilumatobacteraceae bacterium]
ISDGSVPPDTGPPDTSPNSSGVWAYATGVRTWAELGIDPDLGARLNTPGVVYVNPRGGSGFSEGTFPTYPDTGNGAAGNAATSVSSIAAASVESGFILATTIDVTDDTAATVDSGAVVSTSADGVAWTTAQLTMRTVNGVGQLADGTYVVVGTGVRGDLWSSSPVIVARSADGVTWSESSFDALLTEADGASAWWDLQRVVIGPEAIAVVAAVNTDP